MIFVIGGALAFFFEFLLLSKKEKTLADKLLSVWMFLLGLHLFLFYMAYSGLEYEYPFFLGIHLPFPFLHGPMLFLYTGALTNRFKRWKPLYLLHFVPFVLFYIYYGRFFVISAAEKMAFIEKLKAGYQDMYTQYSYPAMLVSAIAYLVLTFFMLRKHERSIRNLYSYSDYKIDLHWLRNLLIGMALIWVVVIIGNLFYNDIRGAVAIYVAVVLFVISMGYFGIRQGNIFVTQQVQDRKGPTLNENIKRYTKSGLKKEDAEKIKEDLIHLMASERVFLDETLSLSKLASKLNVLPNYLSQVINEQFQVNFYDFVNSYRVEEFKKLVDSKGNKNKTLLGLAYESGFASKAAFNSSFKKNMGMTPSEYAKLPNE